MAHEGIKTSKVSPAFLHGNSTSHTWPFSAIAELIDNAYDPDVNASELWIDKRNINGMECLTFVDNGNGLTEDKLYKMLSFGYCDKVPVGGVKPIGAYGNGFKSGSMRLGLDALVFTRSTRTTSIGFLSQSYLKAIGADAVLVPIITWDLSTFHRRRTPASDANLTAVLRHSLFNHEKDLFTELKSLERMKTGTSIIIYNLKKINTDADSEKMKQAKKQTSEDSKNDLFGDKSGQFELDFQSDKYDIRNPETHMIDLTTINRTIATASPEYRRSLREYCSILFLKPRMKIVLRGRKVVTKLISKSLSKTEHDTYRPTWVPRPIKLTFGFTDNTEPESYGLMMYHNNRLIRAYDKIGCQKQANEHGVGVVGVVEANFLDPIHNKQDFNRTDKYSAFMQSVARKLDEYFFEKTQSVNPNAQAVDLNTSQLPDWTWAQCENCLSWRRLPTGYTEKLPDNWFCWLNPDAAFNRCDIPEEPEDDDEALQPSYRKTYFKKREEEKRLAKLAEEQKFKKKEQVLKEKEKLLQYKEKEIARKNEELAEVSSSQDKVDRKPTVRDLEQAQVNLQRSHKKLAEQEQLIRKLEAQKRENEEKRQALLRLAKSVELTTVEEQQLQDKVKKIQGSDTSTVTSSSTTTLRAPIKRKADDNSGPGGKQVKIKTEDGGSISIPDPGTLIDLTSDSDEEMPETPAPDHSEKTNDTPAKAAEKVIDKPTSSEKTDSTRKEDSVNKEAKKDKVKDCDKVSSNKTTEKDDVIKDKVDKVSPTIPKEAAEKSDKSKTKTVEKEPVPGCSKVNEKGDNKSKNKSDDDTYTEMDEKDIKPIKEELDRKMEETIPKTILAHRSSQTVPTVVKFASPEEVDLEKLSILEQKQMLMQKARELDETKKTLNSLQENIWKLLKIIVPDFDYGNPENIESIILDFIRVNGEKS